MKRIALPALLVVLAAASAPAEESPRLAWPHQGLAAVPGAAAEAKAAARRLLLGLSGSPT